MGQICWLASYPKSGNTWLRAFLVNYLRDPAQPAAINELGQWCPVDGVMAPYRRLHQSTNPAGAVLDDASVNRLRPRVQAWLAAHGPDTAFVKTHCAVTMMDGVPTISPELTLAAIYVIRNPLDVAVSYANHFSVETKFAVDALGHKGHSSPTGEGFVFQPLGTWSQHVESWVDAPGMLCHVVRYEDMLAAPIKTFGQIVDFMQLPKDRTRLKKAIRFSSFRELRKQEKADGFEEAAPDPGDPTRNRAFFRTGRAGGWRRDLAPELAERVIASHHRVMRRFGYLDVRDRPQT